MKTMLKTAALAALALASALPAVASAQAIPGAIVAVVNRQRILAECNACKTASGQIQALINQAQQRQQALGAPLQTQGQAIETEGKRIRALPEGAAKNAAIQALQPRIQSFQQQQGTAQQELERLQQNIQSVNANVLRQINEKLDPVVGQVMQQRGANLALDQDATLASARSIDITDQVLTALNGQLTTVSVTPLPQQNAPAQTTGRAGPQPQGR